MPDITRWFYYQLINIFMNYTTFIIIAVVIIITSIRQINQYQKGVKFTLGKFTSIMEPGWRIVWPIIQSYQKVDVRIKAVDVPDQNAITRDNVTVKVNAVIYIKSVMRRRLLLKWKISDMPFLNMPRPQ